MLTKNFSLEELYESTTATRSGIHNIPGVNETQCLRDLAVHILQPLRDYFNKPVIIRSGYRSAPLNRAVGGAHDSQHMKGQAADITINGVGNDLIWQYIRDNMLYDQLILEYVPADNPERGWVHVSFRDGINRKDAISCVAPGDYREGMVYAD